MDIGANVDQTLSRIVSTKTQNVVKIAIETSSSAAICGSCGRKTA
jgi:hypothetical protein